VAAPPVMPYALAAFLLTAVHSVLIAALFHSVPSVSTLLSAATHPATASVCARLRSHFGLRAVMIFAPPHGTHPLMPALVPSKPTMRKITPALV